MSAFRLWILALLLLSGLCLALRQDSGTTAIQPAPPADAETYPPRMVKNVKVRNYNIVGENNVMYDHVPQRVIAVGENINETLVALGVEDKVVCAVRYGNPFYRPEPEYAAGYDRIAFQDGIFLNTEMVLSLSPDLIISGQSLFTEKRLKSTDFWNSRAIRTFFPLNANSPYDREHRESLENEFAFLLGLGSIFNREEKARSIVEKTRALILAVRDAARNAPQPKVMIVEQLGRNLVAYDRSKLAGDICAALGAYVPESPVGTIGLEYLIEEDPDVLFVVKSGGDAEEAADVIRDMPSLESLQCVQQGRVYGIMLNYTYNSAIKTGAGVKYFARGIYPDVYARLFEKHEGT